MNVNYEGLVCYLNAEKSSKQQNQWKDSSGNGNNAILTNVSDNDFNGEYVQFTGNNYATLPRCIQDDFTISAEVILEKSTSSDVQLQYWYAHAALIDAEAANIVNDFGLTISKDGHAYFGVGNPDLTISYTKQSLFGEKHIITCTRSKTSGEFALYLDGCLIQKRVHPNKAALTSSPSIYIGRGLNNKYLSMRLFSIRLYNRVLNEFEINQDTFFLKEKQYINHNNISRLVEKLSDASNIKITGNKYGNRVQTVIDKIVEKADNVTKAINQEVVNNTHSFKAGKGNNVDVSLDAQNGFSALAIKGETYQNILNFDSDITFNLTLENWCIKALPLDSLKVKPNTVYTMVVYVSKVTTTHQELLWVGDVSGRKDTITDEIVRKNVVLGINTFKFTTNSNPQNKPIKFQGSKFVEGTLIFKALLLEGDHTNNVNLPSYFNGIVGVGNVNKNLLNPSTFSPSNGVSIKDGVLNINLLTDGGQRTIYSGLNIPKGIYTVTIEVIEGNYAGGNLIFYNSSNTKYSEVRISGRHVVNTGDNDINKLTLWAIRGVCKLRIQIEKGSIATLYEPYHNGYKVEVVTTGKNLCCAKTVNQDWEFGDSMDTWISSNNLNYHSCEAFAIPHLANKKIYAGLIRNGLAHSDNINFAVIYDKNRVRIGSRFGIPNTGYTLPANAYYIRLMHYAGNSSTLQYIYKDDYYLGLEPITKNAAYEPYQEEKTQILLNEPLMKLPNGVCDEITKDGKLVRRIGKIVLNGNEAWFNNGPWSGGDYQACYIRISNKGGNKLDLVCDKFGVTSQKTNSSNQVTNECCFGEVGNGVLYLIISKQKLSTPDMSGLKRWLSDNPTTVYYELSNPIITDLNNQIKIFKDGHLTFNTLVAPESTHIVQLNKSAQIHNAIKQSQLLDNKIAVLENNYDSLMLSTMSTLNDLEFDYTLK